MAGRSPDGSGSRPSGRASKAVSPVPASIPNAADLHGDIRLMLLASPSDEHSALMKTGMTVREWEFATTSGAYRQIYRPARKEFGFQLTALGKRLKREAQAIEARRAETLQDGSVGDESAVGTADAPNPGQSSGMPKGGEL